MLETSRLILTKFTDETITISTLVMVFVLSVLIAYWLYNRRKFRKLSHQIPASVVKNYLDSIIQNSTSLKSSLFRGGGLELGDGVPSVVPVGNLPKGGISPEELTQKNAEIAKLNRMLSEKEGIIDDLEIKLASMPKSTGGDNSEELGILQNEVKNLRTELTKAKSDLASASASSGGDEALQQRLDEVSKERDELKERLMEYEIIEEDLANLKRLQQENEELKKALQASGGKVPEAPSAPPAPAPEPEPEPEPEIDIPEEEPAVEPEPAAPAEEDDLEAQMAAAIQESKPAEKKQAAPAPAAEEEEVPNNEGEQKSADELLSEFEKMLG